MKPQQWCYSWLVKRPAVVGLERAALVKEAKWHTGDTITISFLDGDPKLQKKVKDAALKWTGKGMANLTFDFSKTKNTDVRVSFRYRGSWSALGTTCRDVTDMAKPTMNFGWLNAKSSDQEIDSVVLHEFGHLLGLIHEHQNPGGYIPWNREQVIHDLSGYPHYWSLDDIERNMFHAFAVGETNFTKMDAKSIMMYPVPPEWTTNKFSVGLNSKLSNSDREFIRREYPDSKLR